MPRIPFCRARVAIACLTLAFTACAKGERSADSAAAAGKATVAPSTLAARPAMPGALTKPIDQYSGDEMYTLVQHLKWVGQHTRSRDCRNAVGCGGLHPTKKTDVEVGAVDTQDNLSDENVPPDGVIYIQATNKGEDEEARYGLQPTKGGKIEYYMIATKDAIGPLQWRLEELDTTPQHRSHKKISAGTIVGCTGHPVIPGARADFRSCNWKGTDSVQKAYLTLEGVQDPMWSACAWGCCTFG